MPNEKNLKPVRTKSEARERGKNGGKASGAARRQRKTLKDNMNMLLGMDVTGTRDFNKLTAMGIPVEEIDNAMLLTAALFQRAKSGDVAAYKEIRDLIYSSGTPQKTRSRSAFIAQALCSTWTGCF